MNGAKEYAKLFQTGQHGRLYLLSEEHARGKTFRIWVLPTDEPVYGSIHNVKDAVEVFGIIGGQPGWSECYGWLHRGKWQQDFAELVDARREEIEAGKSLRDMELATEEENNRQRIKALLSRYDDGEAGR